MSTRFKVVCGVALLVSLLFIGIAVTSNIASASKINKNPPTVPQPNQIGNSQRYAPGVPAIPISKSSSSTANNASPPAFTKNDVIAFLNKHGFYAGPLVKGAHLKILVIGFVPAREASILMKGEDTGRPDNYLAAM